MANKNLPSGEIEITNGPGKFDLMVSNFDFKSIHFACVENGRQFKLEGRILLACPEDGSKEKWLGMVILVNPAHSNYIKDETVRAVEERAYYYDSRSRKGRLFKAGEKWQFIKETV